jgi:hypothetical protein
MVRVNADPTASGSVGVTESLPLGRVYLATRPPLSRTLDTSRWGDRSRWTASSGSVAVAVITASPRRLLELIL